MLRSSAERLQTALDVELRAPREVQGAGWRCRSLRDIAGYRVEALVGRGGMGVVYRARHRSLDRLVALKVIAPELGLRPHLRVAQRYALVAVAPRAWRPAAERGRPANPGLRRYQAPKGPRRRCNGSAGCCRSRWRRLTCRQTVPESPASRRRAQHPRSGPRPAKPRQFGTLFAMAMPLASTPRDPRRLTLTVV